MLAIVNIRDLVFCEEYVRTEKVYMGNPLYVLDLPLQLGVQAILTFQGQDVYATDDLKLG
jgi:hypothetical protein